MIKWDTSGLSQLHLDAMVTLQSSFAVLKWMKFCDLLNGLYNKNTMENQCGDWEGLMQKYIKTGKGIKTKEIRELNTSFTLYGVNGLM